MQTQLVDGIAFQFGDDWRIARYDEWRYYRKRFCAVPEGRKAVDLLAISPSGELYLIEVKDYRQHRRSKPSQISDEISHKLVDTLAALLPASLNENFLDEKEFAEAALCCNKIRIVLHLEQSNAGSRISPRKFRLEDLQLKLRQQLKAIDGRAVASEIAHMGRLGWACAYQRR